MFPLKGAGQNYLFSASQLFVTSRRVCRTTKSFNHDVSLLPNRIFLSKLSFKLFLHIHVQLGFPQLVLYLSFVIDCNLYPNLILCLG